MAELTEKQRVGAVTHAQFLHSYQAHVNWSELRPIPNMDKDKVQMQALFKGGYVWPTDCAGVILWVYRWIDARSPTGLPFDEGGSSAMWSHLPHFSDCAEAREATIGVYGIDGSVHAVMVTKPGKTRATTTVLSHGEAYQCKLLTLAEEDTAHVGQPFTFLSVADL